MGRRSGRQTGKCGEGREERRGALGSCAGLPVALRYSLSYPQNDVGVAFIQRLTLINVTVYVLLININTYALVVTYNRLLF
jgi:hypothetical protein